MNQQRDNIQFLWAVVGGLGLMTVLGGLLLILLGFVMTFPGAEALRGMAWGVGSIFSVLGVGLIWSGITGWRQTPSPRFYGWWLIPVMGGMTLLAFGVGLLLPAHAYDSPLFSLMLATSVVGPALLWLAAVGLAAGYRAAVTLRQMFVAIAGSIASILLAFSVEVVGLLGSSVLVIAVAYALPGGAAEVNRLLALLERWAIAPPQMEEMLTLLVSPVVLGLLVLVLVVITPLIEELGKILVAGVMGWVTRPTLTRAFVWGVACGLGFAMVEGVTNSMGGITDTAGWFVGIGSRFMATGMHALTSGMVGLGLGLAWRKRWWALPLAYLAAVVFHGLWNFSVILVLGGGALAATTAPIGFLGVVLGVALIGALILLTPVGLIGIPLALRRYEARQAD